MDYWSLLILAGAVSIDGFIAGMNYGIKKIIIKVTSLLIISGISAGVIFTTGSLGKFFAANLDIDIARILGSSILIMMGICMIYNTLFNDLLTKKSCLINILNEPLKADFDYSGSINYREAILLGLALALDTVGAGLGIGFHGFKYLLTPIAVGSVNFIFVSCGYYFGNKINNIIPETFKIFPGVVLILFGIGRIIC